MADIAIQILIVLVGQSGKIGTLAEILLSYFVGKWATPAVTGTSLPPCCDFTFTMIDDNRAVLFGGFARSEETNDIYIFNFHELVSGMSSYNYFEFPKGCSYRTFDFGEILCSIDHKLTAKISN